MKQYIPNFFLWLVSYKKFRRTNKNAIQTLENLEFVKNVISKQKLKLNVVTLIENLKHSNDDDNNN